MSDLNYMAAREASHWRNTEPKPRPRPPARWTAWLARLRAASPSSFRSDPIWSRSELSVFIARYFSIFPIFCELVQNDSRGESSMEWMDWCSLSTLSTYLINWLISVWKRTRGNATWSEAQNEWRFSVAQSVSCLERLASNLSLVRCKLISEAL